MTDKKFDIEYNKWLQQIDVSDEDSVWDEIQDELDFIETWDNIQTKLDEVKPVTGKRISMKFWKAIGTAAAIAFLIFIPNKLILENLNRRAPEFTKIAVANENLILQNPGTEKPVIEQNTEHKAKKTIYVKNNNSDTISINKNNQHVTNKENSENSENSEKEINKIYKENRKNETIAKNNDIIDNTANIRNNELTENQIAEQITSNIQRKNQDTTKFYLHTTGLNRVNEIPYKINILPAANQIILPVYAQKPESNNTARNPKQGFTFGIADIGLVYGYKNTWLVNSETRSGLNPKKLNTTILTFYQDIGITSTFCINNRYRFALEYFWKSETGQNYHEYINANLVDKNINLHYSKWIGFYSWNGHKHPFKILTGGYLAKLTIAEEQQDNKRIKIDDSYRNIDYGILAGYEYNFTVKNKIIIKPGFRVSYSIVNIFLGNDVVTNHFNRTKNLEASFNLSVSYKF